MINVLFDMDGTLLDSERSICEAVHEIRKDMGLPALTYETIQHAIHTPNLNCPQIFYGIENFPHKSYKVGFEKYFSKHYANATLFDGVSEMLRACKERNYFLAIASNAPQDGLSPILQRHDVAQYFDRIIGTNPQTESKPSPMMIHKIIAKAPFKTSVFVGNCLKDEGAAKNANIPYLQAKWGEEMCAHNEFSNAGELLAKLDEIAHLKTR